MERHFEMVYPVVHDLVFEVFLAEGLAHAADEMASGASFDVYELGELDDVQVHWQVRAKTLLAIFTKSEKEQKKKKRVW